MSSWSLLSRFLESELFTSDISICVGYLSRYSNQLGIQHVLCNKLRQFAYEEIEFFLPELCHLLVSVDNEYVIWSWRRLHIYATGSDNLSDQWLWRNLSSTCARRV